MILRRFYITENTNGVVTYRFSTFHLLTSPDQAPTRIPVGSPVES